jgi:hypothetical protein
MEKSLLQGSDGCSVAAAADSLAHRRAWNARRLRGLNKLMAGSRRMPLHPLAAECGTSA